MLEQLVTRRKLILLASVSSLLSGCSMFSSDRYSYQPVSYDNSEGSKVLRTAMSQYGAKYKYGKASPSDGFDCSGLIFWAYGKHGITVPRRSIKSRQMGGCPQRPARRYCCFQDRPKTSHGLSRRQRTLPSRTLFRRLRSNGKSLGRLLEEQDRRIPKNRVKQTILFIKTTSLHR
jgi:hypothetical protein